MSYNEGKKAFKSANDDIPANRCMALAADGTVDLHDGDVADMMIGFTETPKLDANVGVKMWNCPGTVELEVAGAVAVGDEVAVAGDGSGKIVSLASAGAGSYVKVGQALDAATTDGHIIEVIPVPPESVTI